MRIEANINNALSVLGSLKQENFASSVVYRTMVCWGKKHKHKGHGCEGDAHHYQREAEKDFKNAVIDTITFDIRGALENLRACNEHMEKRDDAIEARSTESAREHAKK